jgi:hypothetical protein
MTYPVFLGSIVLTSSNNRLRFNTGAAFNVDIPVGTYYLTGTGEASDFCYALQNQLNAVSTAFTVTVEKNLDNTVAGTRLLINRGGNSFGVVVDGAQTFDMALIGFPGSTAVNSSAKYSTSACAAAWTSNDAFERLNPYSEKRASVTRLASGRTSGVSRSVRLQSWTIELGFVHGSRALIPLETHAGGSLDSFIDRFGAGASFKIYDAEINSGSVLANSATFVDEVSFSEDTVQSFSPELIGYSLNLYKIAITAHRSE